MRYGIKCGGRGRRNKGEGSEATQKEQLRARDITPCPPPPPRFYHSTNYIHTTNYIHKITPHTRTKRRLIFMSSFTQANLPRQSKTMMNATLLPFPFYQLRIGKNWFHFFSFLILCTHGKETKTLTHNHISLLSWVIQEKAHESMCLHI